MSFKAYMDDPTLGSKYSDMNTYCAKCRDLTEVDYLIPVGIETKEFYSTDLVCEPCRDKIHSADELTNFNLTE